MTPDIPDCVPLASSAGRRYLPTLVGLRLAVGTVHAGVPVGTFIEWPSGSAIVVAIRPVPGKGRQRGPDVQAYLLDRDVRATYPVLGTTDRRRNVPVFVVNQYRQRVPVRMLAAGVNAVSLTMDKVAKGRLLMHDSGSPVFADGEPLTLVTVLTNAQGPNLATFAGELRRPWKQ